MTYSADQKLNKKVKKIISRLICLKKNNRYLGCFVFGSVARGEFTDGSDIDVIIYVKGRSCGQINHPIIDDIKLDISFYNHKKILELIEEQNEKRKRIPMIAESIILFDKNGEIKEWQNKSKLLVPKELKEKEWPFSYYLIYNENIKVRRYLKTKPEIALTVMHTCLTDLIKTHYQINHKWYVGNKRLLDDLSKWDPPLAQAFKSFIMSFNLKEKEKHWDNIVTSLLKPFGNSKKLEENNCNCQICQQDLKNLG